MSLHYLVKLEMFTVHVLTAQQTFKTGVQDLHIFTMQHAYLLEVRKLQLTVK